MVAPACQTIFFRDDKVAEIAAMYPDFGMSAVTRFVSDGIR